MTHDDTELQTLRRAALETFAVALAEVDAGKALQRRVRLEGERLAIFDAVYELRAHVYAIAIGKAAVSMAKALDEVLGSRLTRGIVAAPDAYGISSRWKVFKAGHPLPNQASLYAAHESITLLRRAEDERALVIFLISGGGSASFEWPIDESITLEELRETNRVLVACGAKIAEVNSVRRAISAVKAGRLSALAPHATQVTLVVSDTNPGEESAVASGPTFAAPLSAPDPRDVVHHYGLENSLPSSVRRAVYQTRDLKTEAPKDGVHFLLLDNCSATEAARRAARAQGLRVEVAHDIIEQPVEEGCRELLSRLLQGQAQNPSEVFCLISGGEFACPVRGRGTGGRNAETVLRCAIELDERRRQRSAGLNFQHAVILSAGTDGIDGNSPAAGAIADERSLESARALNLDARSFLAESDAYTFFQALDDAVTTGRTGTNVRDLRIMMAR
jgi:glycerate 2-kinase